MQKGLRVKDIKPYENVEGIYLVASAIKSLTRKGDAYWSLSISDATGSVDAKIWAPLSDTIKAIPAQIFIGISGKAELFNEKIQVAIRLYHPLETEQIARLNLADFVRCSRISPAILYENLLSLCRDNLNYPPWIELINAILTDPKIKSRLLTAPAAKKIHQAYSGGLLEHTLNVAHICLDLAKRYPLLDKQTLLAGAVLHDIGKIKEFGGLFPDYTDEGQLVGHITLGVELLAPFLIQSKLDIPLQEHLRHLILSHHGRLEYGASVLPKTPEAFALHFADNIDAKLGLCEEIFAAFAEGQNWSEKVWGLEQKIFRPMRTPSLKNKCKVEDYGQQLQSDPIFDSSMENREFDYNEHEKRLTASPDYKDMPDVDSCPIEDYTEEMQADAFFDSDMNNQGFDYDYENWIAANPDYNAMPDMDEDLPDENSPPDTKDAQKSNPDKSKEQGLLF